MSRSSNFIELRASDGESIEALSIVMDSTDALLSLGRLGEIINILSNHLSKFTSAWIVDDVLEDLRNLAFTSLTVLKLRMLRQAMLIE